MAANNRTCQRNVTGQRLGVVRSTFTVWFHLCIQNEITSLQEAWPGDSPVIEGTGKRRHLSARLRNLYATRLWFCVAWLIWVAGTTWDTSGPRLGGRLPAACLYPRRTAQLCEWSAIQLEVALGKINKAQLHFSHLSSSVEGRGSGLPFSPGSSRFLRCLIDFQGSWVGLITLLAATYGTLDLCFILCTYCLSESPNNECYYSHFPRRWS